MRVVKLSFQELSLVTLKTLEEKCVMNEEEKCLHVSRAQSSLNQSRCSRNITIEFRHIFHSFFQIQGAVMVACIVQVVIGFSGFMGFVLRYIGPLAIAPTIALIGLALFKEAADLASAHWYIAFM